MQKEKRINFLLNTAYFLAIGVIFYIIVKFLASWLLPFVIAFIVAYLLNPIITNMQKKSKIKRGFCAVLIVAIFYLIAVMLISLIGYSVGAFLVNVFSSLPTFYVESIQPGLDNLLDALNATILSINPQIQTSVNSFTYTFFESLSNQVTQISVNALSGITVYITKMPQLFLSILISIIASFFIAADYNNIVKFILNLFPAKTKDIIFDARDYGVKVLKKYLISYSIIVSVTFVELSIAFFLLGIEYAVLIALVIAVFDIMPVLGTGGIVVPWAIISLLIGEIPLGVGLFIVYFMVTIIRQILEPKVIGDQVGLHPVATLASMYVGIQAFGVIGLFLLPMSIVILKELYTAGKIKLPFKEKS